MENNFYLNRRGFREQAIFSEPSPNLGLVIVIPSFKEPHLLASLESLKNCDSTNCAVEIIIVINCCENARDEIQTDTITAYQECLKWCEATNDNPKRQFYVLLENPCQSELVED